MRAHGTPVLHRLFIAYLVLVRAGMPPDESNGASGPISTSFAVWVARPVATTPHRHSIHAHCCRLRLVFYVRRGQYLV